MKRSRKFTAVLATLLSAAMLLSSCGAGPTGGGPTGGNTGSAGSGSSGGSSANGGGETIRDTLVIGNSATIDEFDPAEVRSAANMYGPWLTHMTLVEIDGNTKEVVGYLAESYTFDEATSSYIFNLHKDAVFSTGDPVTAEDVKFTLERAQGVPVAAPNLASVVGITALDEHTVSVEVTAPSIEFLYNLAMANFAILSKKACESAEDGYTIGCGPFKQIEWSPDNYVLYERVENYWNGTAPSKYIRYQKIAETSARAIALQTGEIDVDLSLAPSEVVNIQGDKNCKVYIEDGTTLHYMFFNVSGENPALTNPKVRQAVAYAINYDDIINAAWEGYATPTGYIPNASIDTSGYSDLVIFKQDVEKAKALLAEAGYADGFDMTIHHNSIGAHGIVMEIIQSQLAQIGINLTVACADRTQMYSDFATGRGYESGIVSMVFSNTPGRLGSAIYATGEVTNYTNSGNAKADELLDGIFFTNSYEERAQFAYEVNQIMAEDCLFIPLATSQVLYGVRNNVKDLGIYDGSLYMVLRDGYVVD